MFCVSVCHVQKYGVSFGNNIRRRDTVHQIWHNIDNFHVDFGLSHHSRRTKRIRCPKNIAKEARHIKRPIPCRRPCTLVRCAALIAEFQPVDMTLLRVRFWSTFTPPSRQANMCPLAVLTRARNLSLFFAPRNRSSMWLFSTVRFRFVRTRPMECLLAGSTASARPAPLYHSSDFVSGMPLDFCE